VCVCATGHSYLLIDCLLDNCSKNVTFKILFLIYSETV
jgi:hypothetical protein